MLGLLAWVGEPVPGEREGTRQSPARLQPARQLGGDSRPKLLGSEAGGLLIHLTVSRLNQVSGPADFTVESVTATG